MSYWYSLLVHGRVRDCWHQIADYAEAHGVDARTLYRAALQRFAKRTLKRIPGMQRLTQGAAGAAPHRLAWFAPELLEHLTPAPRPDDRTLPNVLRFSVEHRKLPTYLRVEDRNSMAHSVEARVPFLDYRLVTLAVNLPMEWKLRGRWNKYVLREAMRGTIPESVRTRLDKMGFPTSAARWFREQWHEPLRDLLASRATRERGIYRLDVIERDLERHRRGEIDVADRLFEVAQFELWAEMRSAAQAPIAIAG
jgi:asparagine synthase (glutamine-hydrolysing)